MKRNDTNELTEQEIEAIYNRIRNNKAELAAFIRKYAPHPTFGGTFKDFKGTDDQLIVQFLIESSDDTRFSSEGGYPSEYDFKDGKVIWADIRDGKPSLTTLTVDELIEHYDFYIEGLFEEPDILAQLEKR